MGHREHKELAGKKGERKVFIGEFESECRDLLVFVDDFANDGLFRNKVFESWCLLAGEQINKGRDVNTAKADIDTASAAGTGCFSVICKIIFQLMEKTSF